jgi:chromosomal replication initiator protein
MNHKSVWDKILGELKNSQPKHAYSTWFVPIKPIGINKNTLFLELPNQFFYEWIQSHYKKAIEQTAISVIKIALEIKFTVSPETLSLKYEQTEDTLGTLSSSRKEPQKPKSLNAQYTLSSFIQGTHNEFAKAAAKNVAENPGDQSFNPLVVYGGVGMGKTHLLHAIGNDLVKNRPMMRVVCASSEKFTLDFISSIQKNKTVEFSKSYRNADILLIDDIQFFQGKEQTQEQFFHTFNELFQSKKQIVMTADRYPGEMVGLQDRLLSRFKSGLSVDIQPPDFETRVAIVMEKAEQNGLKLSYDIIELIGTHIKTNIRDLEGTIIRLLAHSSLTNREIDYELTKSIIKERLGSKVVIELTVEEIVKRVSETTKIKQKDIVGISRKMEIAEARQISIYLCREILGTPLVSIGMHFGGRDHSTVLHACRVIEKKSKIDQRISNLVGGLKSELTFAKS